MARFRRPGAATPDGGKWDPAGRDHDHIGASSTGRYVHTAAQLQGDPPFASGAVAHHPHRALGHIIPGSAAKQMPVTAVPWKLDRGFNYKGSVALVEIGIMQLCDLGPTGASGGWCLLNHETRA